MFDVGHPASQPPVSKSEVRATTRDHRASAEHSLIDAAVISHLLTWLGKPRRVAAYSPLPGEPGGPDLVSALATQHEVWLPITPPEGDLRWGRFDGDLRKGAHFGILEPSGPTKPHLNAIPCDVVIVPALGVDRSGVRLGQGAGYYDRALHGVQCPILALVYDDEVHDTLPFEPHDHAVDGAVTQSGFIPLGTGRGIRPVQ